MSKELANNLSILLFRELPRKNKFLPYYTTKILSEGKNVNNSNSWSTLMKFKCPLRKVKRKELEEENAMWGKTKKKEWNTVIRSSNGYNIIIRNIIILVKRVRSVTNSFPFSSRLVLVGRLLEKSGIHYTFTLLLLIVICLELWNELGRVIWFKGSGSSQRRKR